MKLSDTFPPKQYKVTLGYPIEVVVQASDKYEAEDEARPYALDILQDIFDAPGRKRDGEFELLQVELITEDD